MTVGNLAVAQARAVAPAVRLFILRVRLANGAIEEATEDAVLREGDIVAVAGAVRCW